MTQGKMRNNLSRWQAGLAGVLASGLLGCAAPRAAVRGGAEMGAGATDASLGREALSRMGGCFIVDYNFHETRPLAEGYARDERVYDVNQTRTVMEWVYPIESGKTLRLQHVLFALDEQGRFHEEALLRHQAEDWEYAPASYFEYEGASRWKKQAVP
ncbi:MAG: hypothetical protein L0Y66_07870, partial [Myxococcaceae bacterium]|nr:hypothetical protein [Myxococcaceae bacterium]